MDVLLWVKVLAIEFWKERRLNCFVVVKRSVLVLLMYLCTSTDALLGAGNVEKWPLGTSSWQ